MCKVKSEYIISKKMLRLRLRGPGGNTVTGSFDPTQSLGDFLVDSATRFGENEVEMLTGFPPKLCTAERDVALGALIASGASVTFRRAEPAEISVSPSLTTSSELPETPSTTSSTSVAKTKHPLGSEVNSTPSRFWSCVACTLENSLVVALCAACETPRTSGGGGVGGGGGGGSGDPDHGIKAVAVLEKMADDNSCLFHGVAWVLDPSSSPHDMRQRIAAAVRSDPSRWNEGTLGKPPGDYCTFITNSTKWGGQVELCVLAEHYRAEVSVTDVQTGRADVYGSGEGYRERCYLVFTGIHFDAVGFQKGIRRIPCSDPLAISRADEAVAALATRQRSGGHFTDQTTMRLRCKACGHIMEGDLEARMHAGSSGHKDFVQA